MELLPFVSAVDKPISQSFSLKLSRQCGLAVLLTLSLLTGCGGSSGSTPDTTAPVITLNGATQIDHEYGTEYVDAGAVVTDNDADVTVITTGTVDIDVLGATYTLTYSATDSSGNVATPITRTVTIVDTAAPVITLNGETSLELGEGRDYLEYGATAFDEVDGEFTLSADDITQEVSSAMVGDVFTVTYQVSDAAGNVSEAITREVTIVAPRPFIFTYQTLVANETYTLEADTESYDFDYSVDWGDGVIEEGLTTTTTHTYADADVYTVSISGDFPLFSTYDSGMPYQYLSVEQWGDIHWQDVYGFLYAAKNLVGNATDTPDLSGVVSLRSFFSGANSFNGDISRWQVGHITNMSNVFKSTYAFNQDLSGWDVSSATNMGSIFQYSGFNQDISGWDVSSVTSMVNMFYGANAFNQDISGWDVSSVTTMSYMFKDSSDFDQNLASWQIQHVETMSAMFRDSALSTANYDALLMGWSTQTVSTGVLLGADTLVRSSESDVAVAILEGTYGWVINDATPE